MKLRFLKTQINKKIFTQHQMEMTSESLAAKSNKNLVRYSDKSPILLGLNLTINVHSEFEKNQLLSAFKYLHDCYIDTDIIAVNALIHLCLKPELITINNPNTS